MNALRLVLVGCLLVVLAGCGLKEKAKKAVEKEAERQKKAKAGKEIVGRWQSAKENEGNLWIIEFTKDGKVKQYAQGPDDDAPKLHSGPEAAYALDGDKLTVTILAGKKPGPDAKPATLAVKELTDKSLVLEGEKGNFVADVVAGEFKRLNSLPTNKEKIVGTWEAVQGDGADMQLVAELAADGKLKLNTKAGPAPEGSTYAVDGNKLKIVRKDGSETVSTIKKLTGRTLATEDEKGKTSTFKKRTGAAPTLVGTWVAVKGDGVARELQVEYRKDGTYWWGSQKKGMSGAKYEVEGPKIKIVTFAGSDPQPPRTIKLLTEHRLITATDDGKIDEFTKK